MKVTAGDRMIGASGSITAAVPISPWKAAGTEIMIVTAIAITTVMDTAATTGLAVDKSFRAHPDDMHKHYCPADTRGGVQLVKQNSDSSCRQGKGWGYDRRGIWVNHGCRADFQVGR